MGHGKPVVHAVVMVVHQGIGAAGVGDRAAPRGRRAAQRGLAYRPGHRRQGHAHERQVPGTLVMVVVVVVVRVSQVMVPVVVVVGGLRGAVPGPDDLRLGPVREDVQDAEGLDPSLGRGLFPVAAGLLLFLLFSLYLHHLEPLQGLEVVVAVGTPGSPFRLVVVVVGLPEGGYLAAEAPPSARPPVSLLGVPAVLVVDVDYGGGRVVGQSLVVAVGLLVVVLGGGGDHEGQGTRAPDRDLAVVVVGRGFLHRRRRAAVVVVPEPAVLDRRRRRAQTGARGRRRGRHGVRGRFRHLRAAHRDAFGVAYYSLSAASV